MNSVCQILVPPPLPGCDHYPTFLDYVFSNALMLTDLMNHQMKPFINRALHKGNFRVVQDKRSDMNQQSLSAMNANDGLDYLANALNLLGCNHIPMAYPPTYKPARPIRPPTSLIHKKTMRWCN